MRTAWRVWRQAGFASFRDLAWERYRLLPCALHRRLNAGREFDCLGRRFRYALDEYNYCADNERTVEVAVCTAILGETSGRVLEIGNVLSHYVSRPHDVVDKYEVAPGVLNLDVVDFEATEPYDLIVSISTLEHVGLDEAVREPDKAQRAVERLLACLAPGGQLVLTVPLGYNRPLETWLQSDDAPFAQRCCLARRRWNRWVEVPAAVAAGLGYHFGWRRARAVLFAVAQAPSGS